MKLPCHNSQTFPVIGAVFIGHFCMLGNGVDRSSAGNQAHIESGDAVFFLRNRLLVKSGDHSGKGCNGIGASKVTERVASFCRYGYFPPFRTDCAGDHAVRLAVKGYQRMDSSVIILHNLPDTLQVAKAFLAAVEYH